ncbi:hypothetical protein GUITHDRAFT_122765 [Guillardia theta CCMP2712]|uniref:SAM domain-containing protein n=1 Tax=Guillardia theta (strain CCMP2712) TaxID=905079 RepID=L1I463_GUITC|nr:hypothetical protein GUITHDRAFT_122765 [Guillardia theta CCMP2712]EKX31031.1 hypothetical protein GUITHDRAFT_122765 [Guillardia theta CCMP2712]|eukprot:XP_005818011.1 hypothetical protein GUITHDRAFT_122765 [Guillardia theta CCMP2712]
MRVKEGKIRSAEDRCKHSPSQWRSSNVLTPAICKLMLGRSSDREISHAMEHFSQIGQCQCGKKVILCKVCPLSGDKLAEGLPKLCGQRLPNPITVDNRASRNASFSWHLDPILSVSYCPPDDSQPRCSLWLPAAEPSATQAESQAHQSLCNNDSPCESANPTPSSEAAVSSEDTWFALKAKLLREQNLKIASDSTWTPFPHLPASPWSSEQATGKGTRRDGRGAGGEKILPAINLDYDYFSYVKLHGLSNGWPDFVFQEDFMKPSLHEVVAYAKKHKHLPGVIPEKSVHAGDFSCQREIASVLQYVEMLVLWAKELSDCNKLLEEQIGQFKKAHATGDERELMMKVSKLLSNIVTKKCIQQLQLSRPQGAELLQWMRENGLICFARVFSKNGLYSLEHVAKLDQQDCESLTCSLESLGSVGKRIELQLAVQHLRGDMRAKDMNYRLEKFNDSKVPVFTAWSSLSATEIILSKVYFQTLFCLYGLLCISQTFRSMSEPMYSWYGITNRSTPAWCIVFVHWPCVQLLGGWHDKTEPWTLHKSLTRGFLFEYFSLAPFTIVMAYLFVNRQDMIVTFMALVGLQQGLVLAPMHLAQASMLRAFYNLTSGLVFWFAYFTCTTLKWSIQKKASRRVNGDKKKYAEQWSRLLQVPANQAIVTRLIARTERIEQTVDREYRACFAAATMTRSWRFRNLFQEPVGRFSFKGKVRQQTNNFGQLFWQASSVNDHFHEFLADLLKKNLCHDLNPSNPAVSHGEQQLRPELRFLQRASLRGEVRVDTWDNLIFVRGPIKQPERAIQKCVRIYGRDSACLTDLVRATVVVEQLEQVEQLLAFLESISVIGTKQDRRGGKQQQQQQSPSSQPLFRIVRVKNRFSDSSRYYEPENAYRNLSINLEVGWVFEEEQCKFLPVSEWDLKMAETHICELQVHLLSLYEQYQEGSKNYVLWRDMLTR